MKKRSPGESRKRTLFLLGAIIVLTVVASRLFLPEIAGAYSFVTGRAGICSLWQSMRGVRQTIAQVERNRELREQSKVIETAGDGTELWSTPSGDWWTAQGNRGALFYDLAEQDRDIYWAASEIRPGDVVLDCGANIGLFAKKALAAGASHVVAIEPAPENLAALKKNLAAEIAAGQVTVYEKGVWDRETVLTMHRNPTNSAANSFVFDRDGGDDIQLPLTTIDMLVSELGLERVDFIKLDIEGAERQAIAGGKQTIQRFRPRIALCLYHAASDAAELPAALQAVDPGYELECACMNGPDSVFAEVGHFRAR